MGYVIAGGIGAVVVGLVLWAGRNDDSSESTLQNTRRGIMVIAAIAVVFIAIVWVSTYGN